MDTLLESGDFEASTNTRSEATGEVLRLIVDEFWRLQRERVSESELASAKAYITGNFPQTVETPDSIAVQVLNAVFYGLPLEQLQTFRERVNAVRVDDIERVARYYLKPDAVSVVLVGNASVFAPQLRGVGFGRYESIPLENLDLLTADFKKSGRVGRAGGTLSPAVRLAAYQQPSQAAPAIDDEQGTALFARVLAAKGGRAPLDAVKSITAVTAATMQTPAGKIETETTTYLEYPNHVRVETRTPQGLQVQVYDGLHGWVRDRVGVHDVPAAGLREMDASLKRDTIAALLAASRGALRTRLLSDTRDTNGESRRTLELSSPSVDPVVFWINPQTGVIARQTYVVGPPGQPLVEELLSDYRQVSGVSIPFASEIRSGGRSIVARRITDISIVSTPLDPQLFRRPSS